MKTPHKRLRDGLKAAGLTTADFANLIGRHRTLVTHIMAGRATPSLEVAVAIERLSERWPGGAIRPADWIAPTRRRVIRAA